MKKTDIEKLKEKQKKWSELSKVINFLESKGLELKECVYLKARAEFVKGKILEEKIKENLEEVCKQVNQIMGTNVSPEKPDKAIQELYTQFKSLDLIFKACREDGDKKKNVKKLLPYEQLAILNKCNCGKNHDDLENPDHEKNLDLYKLNSFEPTYFYIINIYRGKSRIYFYLCLIIIGILLYALMPVWPYKMKVAVWWISYVLLMIMIGIYIIRYSFFVLGYIIGYEFWIFPNLDDPKLGVIDSFKPFFSFKKRSDKWYFIILRIIFSLITGYIAFCIYKNPKLIENAKNIVFDAIRDLYHYGEDRFVNNNSTALSLKNKKKYMSLEDLDQI